MPESLHLHDFAPAPSNLREEVLDGLRKQPKQLPSKLFYNERGSQLFERITELDEYYVTRCEQEIMDRHMDDMAALIGSHALVIEYGSGNSQKIRTMLDHLVDPVAYVPIDISRDHLLESATLLAADYPSIEVIPVCADYEVPFTLPKTSRPVERNVLYFPGSTIGNFHHEHAAAFLARCARLTGSRGAMLIGVDLVKDRDVLLRAYDDGEGVTAAFNLNMLLHLNEAIGTDFDIEAFRHRALYNEKMGRMEMHLVSTVHQTVSINGDQVTISEGESIWTESSYKYTVEGFGKLARGAGFEPVEVWTDANGWFSVQYLTTS